ncbi:TPA: hypothetical protein KNH08_001899 [Serratia fonticola]|nr:hypothetical protein [Serratia fonticola]
MQAKFKYRASALIGMAAVGVFFSTFASAGEWGAEPITKSITVTVTGARAVQAVWQGTGETELSVDNKVEDGVSLGRITAADELSGTPGAKSYKGIGLADGYATSATDRKTGEMHRDGGDETVKVVLVGNADGGTWKTDTKTGYIYGNSTSKGSVSAQLNIDTEQVVVPGRYSVELNVAHYE